MFNICCFVSLVLLIISLAGGYSLGALVILSPIIAYIILYVVFIVITFILALFLKDI